MKLNETLKDRLVVASVSGGKDSAALSLWLSEQGIEHRRVFMDTGWEHPATYEYLRGPLTAALGPIEEIRSQRGGMEEWIRHKTMFPSRKRRWCTEVLKVEPMRGYLQQLMEAGEDVVNAVGIRAVESKARAKLGEWEWSEAMDCEVWRPLIHWTDQDVIDIHTKHGLRPNPLYLLGAERVGCWPCVYARKSEIRFLADTDPARVARLRELEAEVGRLQATKRAEQGKEALGPPGWFQAPLGGGGACWPIDEVVAWSRTAHGGRQFELFSAGVEEAGCVRWGLCDTGAQKSEDASTP